MTKTVKEWLEGLDCSDLCTNVELVTVTIRVSAKTVLKFNGARYTQREAERIYLLGECPKEKFRRPNKTCFQYNGAEWYIAAYAPKENITPANKEFHPFGPTFLLMQWNIEGSKIDSYEKYPYDRLTMTVEVIKEKELAIS